MGCFRHLFDLKFNTCKLLPHATKGPQRWWQFTNMRSLVPTKYGYIERILLDIFSHYRLIYIYIYIYLLPLSDCILKNLFFSLKWVIFIYIYIFQGFKQVIRSTLYEMVSILQNQPMLSANFKPKKFDHLKSLCCSKRVILTLLWVFRMNGEALFYIINWTSSFRLKSAKNTNMCSYYEFYVLEHSYSFGGAEGTAVNDV